MLDWLRKKLRPVKCANFDCCHEWNGTCSAESLEMGMYDPADLSSLVCRQFQQVCTFNSEEV